MINDVIADLKADAPLNLMIEGRLYRGVVPSGTQYPLILFEANREIQNTLSGQSSLQKCSFDFEIHAQSYVDTKQIMSALDTALSAGTTYKHVVTFVDDGRFNDETEQYTLTAEISIWG